MEDKDKKLELIRKLKVLAERGVGGEEETAKKKLDLLIRKYNIDINNLDPNYEEYDRYPFYYKGKYEKIILVQVYAMVTKDDDNTVMYYGATYTGRRSRNRSVIKCTKSQSVEIQILYEFYLELFYEDLDLFLMAFINKHNLFGNPVENEDDSYVSKYTKDQLFRMSQMEMGMQNKSMTQRLEDKSYNYEGDIE